MTPSELKKTKIVVPPGLGTRPNSATITPEQRERDMRPGRFAVTGPFIKLSDLLERESDAPDER